MVSSNARVIAQAYRLRVRVLHLSRLTPRFLMAGDGQHRFSPVLFDFRYFTDTAAAEARVDGSRHLQSLEQEMQEGYGVFLAKLWGLYTSTVQLQQQALTLLGSLPQDVESQQTMIALLGSVLLLLDKCIPSLPRERSIVAHIRLNSSSQLISNQAPAVVRLFAATGYAPGKDKFPAGYPEQYLARCKLPKATLRSIIAHGSSSLPSAPHASAQQLYIVLYFLPEALHVDTALMKAIMARHFCHSWVLPWAPGHFADLSLHWQGYRAARNALGAVVTPAAAKQLAATHGATALPLQRRRTQRFQDKIANGTQGLDGLPELLSCIMANNTVLRWLLLHTGRHHRGKQATAVAKQAVDQEAVVGLLLDTAALEHWVRSASRESMQQQWAAHCHSISTKLAHAADSPLSSDPANLRRLAEQAAQMPVADVKAVEQLQLALEALQSSSSPSASSPPSLPAQHSTAQHESGSSHHPPTGMEAVQLRSSPSSSPHPGDTGHAKETMDDPDLAALDAYSSPSQNPFPDFSQPSPPPASAGVDGWNPWADDLNRRSSSSPHYQPGSSDSDWDDPDPQRDRPDDPDSAQDHPPRPTAAEQNQEGSIVGASQTQTPPVASAMAEAQHRLDQLVGLATSHSGDVEQTLVREADLGYAWGLMDNYIEHLQRQIRTDPAALPKFSALIFKLRSVMSPPLTALAPSPLPASPPPPLAPPPSGLGLEDSQAAAAEVVSYFTAGLLTLTQSVLQVIPELFFNMVEVVSTIHETHALSLPDRPEKAQLREYAHLPQRAELAQLTQQLAAYAGNLKAFDSACVAPQQHNTMKALRHAIATGIARRISRLLTHRLTFSHAPGGVLMAGPPVQRGGLLSGVAAGFGGSSGEIADRGELSTQLSQLAAELHRLETGFETMQDFVQLPLVFMWQQQLASVVHQALARELSSLPHSLQAELRQQQAPLQETVTTTHHTESAQTGLPNQAANMTPQLTPGHATMPQQAPLPDQARQHDRTEFSNSEGSGSSGLVHAQTMMSTSAENLNDSSHRGRSGPAFGPLLSDALMSQQPAHTQSAVTQKVAHGHKEEHQASVSALPVEAMARLPSTPQLLPSTAQQARLPGQATSRGLPKQATPAAQPTFLRMCLAEVLRLTDPGQSQYQPLLCGWYTSEGVELIGVRGCRALRQVLGVAGVRALVKLLQARMTDGVQQLSAALSSSNTDTLNLDALGAVSPPASQPGSGLPAIPDPAAFKEAIRSGGKLWPLLCHYLAPVGQACLIRQRLASDLRTAERLLAPGRVSLRSTGSAFATSDMDPSPQQQPHHESPMPAAHQDTQARASADLSSQTYQALHSPASQVTDSPFEPASQDADSPFEPASQHLGTANQPVANPSQESDASSPLARTAVQPLNTYSEPMPTARQEVPSASQPVAAASSHCGAATQQASAASQVASPASQEACAASQEASAASQEASAASQVASAASQEASVASQKATAASQLPNAPLEPVPTSSQQSITGSASRRADSVDPNVQPGASAKGPDQASDHGLHSASLRSGSQEGVVMLLCILSLMPRCSFNARLGILERQHGSTGLPDICAVVQGLAVWLQSQHKQHLEVLLCTANQYISAYTQVATSTTALSVQAAGIQIGLPAEIGRLLAFLEQTVEASGKGRQLLKQFLPPFLLDNWQCLVLSEKSL